MIDTSWNKVSKWYNKGMGDRGGYFHQNIIIPKSLELLNLQTDSSLIDLACGQGVLARQIPKNVPYLGVDLSSDLTNEARRLDQSPIHEYVVDDVTKPIDQPNQKFSHAVCLLALQNIRHPQPLFDNVTKVLKSEGLFLIVINHPCFRIPRQTSWEIDPKTKIQYRKINRYLSPLEVPIITHPGEKNSPLTWSFHFPLSDYTRFLNKSNFVIKEIQEWVSDKESVGKSSKMENLSRHEFPMFMALLCQKAS